MKLENKLAEAMQVYFDPPGIESLNVEHALSAIAPIIRISAGFFNSGWP